MHSGKDMLNSAIRAVIDREVQKRMKRLGILSSDALKSETRRYPATAEAGYWGDGEQRARYLGLVPTVAHPPSSGLLTLCRLQHDDVRLGGLGGVAGMQRAAGKDALRLSVIGLDVFALVSA